MCGIVGYAGNVRTACGKPLEVCLQGLQRLEYRGYDSAGVALTAPGMERVAVRKKAGRLANLVQDIERDPMPDATVGIGHTRWATNGVPNDTNAHPHTSRDGKVAIIHNGIIENASQLRLDLQTEGYRFVSETDTEVAAKLLGKISDKIIEETGKPDLFKAIRRLARMLEGAFTILATDVRQPDIVVGARHDSPLVVGLGEGENFLGSDVAAFVAYTKRAMEIDQDQAVMVSADKVVVSDFMGNIVEHPKTYTVDWDASAAEKGGWDSFMDKEIHEDPAAVQRTLLGRLDENGNIKQKTEDLVGPYELHDFFLYHFLRFGATPSKIFYLAENAFGTKYSRAVLKKWLHTFFRRFFMQQFKRSCLPDGPKVGTVAVSPRGDLRMSSDSCVRIWMDQVEKLS